MISQASKVYISKAIADKDYGELYAQIGNVFNTNIESFKTVLTDECVEMCEKLFQSTSINEMTKSKCLGFMRVCPYLLDRNIIDTNTAKEKILNVVCSKINERKHSNESYAQIATTGGCGLYIELLCKFCDSFTICKKGEKEEKDENQNEDINIDEYKELLTELKTIKTIPARVRFMIEDTLEELNKK